MVLGALYSVRASRSSHLGRWASAIVMACAAVMSHAEIVDQVSNSDAPQHPWLSTQITRSGAAAYFTNIRAEESVQSPFVVKFGLSHWNLAPAKYNVQRTGHHHLLIDKQLPLPPDTPIPFDDHHVHFGAGQMETVLNLPPGRHTLRLLLANHAHVPYFVYSPEMVVNVRAGASNLPENTGKVRKLEFLNLPEDGKVRAPFKLQFHASGVNVASARSRLPTTGHFVVKFMRPGSTETIAFKNGATEDWFSPPPGEYKVELNLVKNGNVSESLARTETTIQVVER